MDPFSDPKAVARYAEAEKARSAIAARLPIVAPEDDEQLLSDAGFRDISLFYAGFAFRGWVAYA